MAFDADALEAAGFAHDGDAKSATEEFAERAGMHQGGPYTVHGVWKKGLVTVLVEQNTTTESNDGLDSVVNHPAVAVVQGPSGKVGVMADDTEGILNAAEVVG